MNDQNALLDHSRSSRLLAPYDLDVEYDQESGGLDLTELKARFYRQRWTILGCLGVALLIGVGIVLLMPKSYSATSLVQVSEAAQLIQGQEALDPSLNDRDSSKVIKAQVALITSRDLAQEVEKGLKIHSNPSILKAVGVDTSTGTDPASASEALRWSVSAKNPWDSQIIEITFASRNPQVSAQLANAYAENLIASEIRRRYEAGAYARTFLSEKLAEAKKRLEQSERAAIAYARSAQVVDTGGTAAAATGEGSAPSGPSGGGSLSAASLVQMNADLSAARTARIQAEQRWRQASATPLMSLPEVIENGTISGLLARKAQLSSELARVRDTFRDDYPDVTRLQSEIGQIDKEINIMAGQVRNTIAERYRTAARQEASMAGRMGGLRADTLAEQDRRVQYDIINREAGANRALYESLLQRFQEVSTAAGLTPTNMSILERAAPVDAPTSPNVPLILAIAAFGGLAAGTLFALMREMVDDRIRSPDEVFEKLRLPLLGTTPPALEDVREELTYSNSPISEAYHSIRSSIEVSSGRAPRTLLITSSKPGEGKSTTALALAVDFASHGFKVLLVDADLRRPGLHKLVGGTNELGFSDVLIGNSTFDSALQHFGEIDFIASGRTKVSPAEILARGRVSQFLSKNTPAYDLVLMDGPPVMGLADAPQIAQTVDATVLVVESASGRCEHLKAAVRRLYAAQANVVGVVLTKFSPKAAGYYSRYGDTYSYRYGSAPAQPRLIGAA